MSDRTVILTGGAGYIGSHTLVELVNAGYRPVIIDNFSNSVRAVLERLQRITGTEPVLHVCDIRDETPLTRILEQEAPSAVIHFAGLKAVGESTEQPLLYYDNNVTGTLCLLRAMRKSGVRRLVFSSSATVYGDPASVPIREDFPLSATNPYGWSKLMVEQILEDLCAAEPDWQVGLLRYFNPVGAHESGLIGEDPRGTPNNLMPYIAQVAVGRLPRLSVYGDDYPTVDGTGVRDYIHVSDLALGHVAALQALETQALSTPLVVNLGTGKGYSVLEAIQAFERASGQAIPYQVVARRSGDVASCYADPKRAEQVLGWRAQRGLDRMCEDAWRWQSGNPRGYGEL
jgi:UDP-glucose 4-epimerase